MKKLLKLLPFLIVAFMTMSFCGCDDDYDDIVISERQLPTSAKTFLSQYYSSAKVVKVTKDDNEYEVVLSNGHRVDFDRSGEWQDVEAPKGQTVPSGFFPSEIDIYVGEKFNGAGINEISRAAYGYDVELINGSDLMFSTTGSFLGYDD